MPYHGSQTIPAKTWIRVTTASVTALRLQSNGPYDMLVQATADTTEPAGAGGALTLGRGKVILPDAPLASLFPGVAAAAHVWVWSAAPAEVSVSHA